MLNRLSIILIAIAFVGCEENLNTNKSIVIEQKSIIKETNEIPAILQITDTRYAYLKGIVKYENTYYLEADYVDYLTGQEAADAEWRDKAYFVDGEDTITNITDGYYIFNTNDLIRTFPIQPNMVVTLIRDDNGSQKLEEPKEVDEKLLTYYVLNNILVILHIRDGEVFEIEEQFIP
jgi:hypothetical protein